MLIAFLEKFARPEALVADVPLPGFTANLVAGIAARYSADLADIARLPGVTLITP